MERTLDKPFTMNGTAYITDAETIEVLREFNKAKNNHMMMVVVVAGEAAGRVAKM